MEIGAAGRVSNLPNSLEGTPPQREPLGQGEEKKNFGEIWNSIQAKYGAKAEKPREAKKTLGKEDFLKIMVTQMKHQDPTNPMKADQFAAQMAQLAQVEQLQNLNQGMNKLSQSQQPAERMAMTGLIGKFVTIDRERFPHVEGENQSLVYSLPKEARELQVSIVSADSGEVVVEQALGAQKGGENSFLWDGLKSNRLPAKSGQYLFKVSGIDTEGRAIRIETQAQVPVVGLSFEGQEAVLLVGDARSPQKVSLKNVTRVETQGAAPKMAQPLGARAAMDSQPVEASKGIKLPKNFIELAPRKADGVAPVKGEGFPNGLQEQEGGET
jgi:flagellar basal-body rod modification protein FlgD